MDEILIIIQAIQDSLTTFDPEYIGESNIDEQAGCLTLLEGRLSIRAEIFNDEGIHPSIAHVHVISTIDSFPEGPLNTCVIGISENREEALAQAGSTWVSMAGDPILSLCHAREIGNAMHFSGDEKWGVQGCHGFAGPVIVRMSDGSGPDSDTLMQAGMFDNVAELTPGGLIHIAKVTLSNNGNNGWKRQLEINGVISRFKLKSVPSFIPV